MKRVMTLEGMEQPVQLVFSKYATPHIHTPILDFDELPDKTWRLTCSNGLFKNFSDIASFQFKGLSNLLDKPHHKLGALMSIEGTDQVWEIQTLIPVDHPTVRMLGFTRLRTGKWKMVYSKSLLPDITQLTGMSMLRQG